MERKIEGQKQNQKGGNGMKNLVVYEHECMKAASYHLNKYKHWAKLLTGVDVTKSNGFAFIGEWLQVTSQNQVIEGSLVVEYCGYDGSREFKLYRVTQSGKQEVAAASRQTIVEFIRKAAEELKKVQKSEEEIEEVEEQKVEEKVEEQKEEKQETIEKERREKGSRFSDGIYYFWKAEKKEENQKEEKEMRTEEEKKRLIDFIEEQIMDGLFNEDGDLLINVSDVMTFTDEEVIEVVENLGLRCEKAEGDGNFRVSLPEEYIIPHNNWFDLYYFAKQGSLTDDELAEVIDDLIQYKGFDKNGEVILDTELWSVVLPSQFERVAGYMGLECEFWNTDFETEGGIVIFRKSS